VFDSSFTLDLVNCELGSTKGGLQERVFSGGVLWRRRLCHGVKVVVEACPGDWSNRMSSRDVSNDDNVVTVAEQRTRDSADRPADRHTVIQEDV